MGPGHTASEPALGQERCKCSIMLAQPALSLMQPADHLRVSRWACHACCITGMVPVAQRLLLLFSQGVQKVATLVRKDVGRDYDHTLRGIQVRSSPSIEPLLQLG